MITASFNSDQRYADVRPGDESRSTREEAHGDDGRWTILQVDQSKPRWILHLSVQAKLIGITARAGRLSGLSGRADERNCSARIAKERLKVMMSILQ
jgi:hypothetical protein